MITRCITAFAGIPLFLWLLVQGGTPWFVLVAVLLFLAAFELSGLFASLGIKRTAPWILAGGFFFLLSAYTSGGDGVNPWHVSGFVVAGALLLELFQRKSRPLQRAGAICLGSLYLGLFGYLYLDRLAGLGPTLMAVLGTWTTDTAAFVVGSRLGKTPLAPAISPNKTREGAMAGAVGGIIAGTAIAFGFGQPVWQGVVMGLGVAIAAQAGDLIESAMKREANVKDSGNLLPGHGGVLDRFDSLIFAGFAVYYLQLLFGWS